MPDIVVPLMSETAEALPPTIVHAASVTVPLMTERGYALADNTRSKYIDVTTGFKESSKSLVEVRKHIFQVINITKSETDITSYVNLQTLKIVMEKHGMIGLISTNTASFDIKLGTGDDVTTIIENGDKVQVKDTYEGETTILFTGYVQRIPINMKNMNHIYPIKLYDRIKNGLNAKFQQHEVKIGWHLCNNTNTSQSLAHYLAYAAGLTDADLVLEDVKDSAGNYITINYARFEKGKRVMDEFSELVASVCGALFMNNVDELLLFSPFNEEDYQDISYTFDTNITEEIERTPVPAEYDKVLVTYDSFTMLDRQVCWMFYSKDSYDAANDEANMLLTADTTSAWYRINWVTDIVVNNESASPEIAVEDASGADMAASFNYEIEADATGGKVRFINLSPDTDIYIQRFKIYGKPLRKLSGNEMSYHEAASPEKALEIENKYIQTDAHAEMVAKYQFHQECHDRTKYKLSSYFVPFLAVSNLVTLNKRSISSQQCTVERFIHRPKGNMPYTPTIELQDFVPYTSFLGTVGELVATPNIGDDLLEFDQTKLEETTTQSEGLPVPQPTGVTAAGSFRHIWIYCDESTRGDLKGYNFYVTDVTDPMSPVNYKYFAQTNGKVISAQTGHNYEIQVSTVCIAGESEKAGVVTASTVQVGTADIQNLSIVNALIADATIDDAKIANLSAAKINAGILALTGSMKVQNADGSTYLGAGGLVIDGSPGANADDVANAQANAQTYADNNFLSLLDAGALAYEDVVELAKLGTTIIQGGYLLTSLIEANSIATEKLQAINADIRAISAAAGAVLINSSGVVVTDGAITVENSTGTVIIDGTSNMFKIHQTGTVSVGTTADVDVSFPSLGYRPAFMYFLLDDIGGVDAAFPMNERPSGGYVSDDMDAWSYADGRVRFSNYVGATTVRYYILKEEAI